VRPPPVLDSSSTNVLFDGVELPDLPRTFKDAIHIVQIFGMRYLWIDSLCIIQDSLEDWQREAAQMDSIYLDAYLTLTAASSTDSNGGCYINHLLPTMVKEVNFAQSDGSISEVRM
jgi:heterokaryon incompatibility protein (HET)